MTQSNAVRLAIQDGTSLVSGWVDGKVRAFGPQSGQLQYTIHDAHKGEVGTFK